MVPKVPDGCEVRRGNAPILLIAPHGGRRPPIDPLAPPANLRVNDVYTPEVTRDLARGLDASAIINTGVDRNLIDLNRASQVRRLAPWFLDLIAEEATRLIDRHGRAEVIFIHGWNNGQIKCDIGVGGSERSGALVVPPNRTPSASDAYLRGRVAALREACRLRGIAAPLGEKYPASHPNNLVQSFAPGGSPDPRFERLARERRVEAMQIELTLPLRSPGPWRGRFHEAMLEAFGGATRAGANPDRMWAAAAHPLEAPIRSGAPTATAAPESLQPASNRGAPPTLPPPTATAAPESLQLYDPASGIGLFAGVGRMSPRTTGGRLLLFLGGQRIALFTGEEAGASGVPPLHFERRDRTLALRFQGPILVIADAAEYLDLEAALAASVTVEADLAVDFDEIDSARGSATLGRARGELSIDGQFHRIGTEGFSDVASLRSAGAGQTMLAASFGAGRAVVGRISHAGEARTAAHFTPGGVEMLGETRLSVVADGDDYTPASFEWRLAEHPLLRAEPLSRMAILRSSPHGYVRVAFGVARFDWGGDLGFGLYEHALPVRP